MAPASGGSEAGCPAADIVVMAMGGDSTATFASSLPASSPSLDAEEGLELCAASARLAEPACVAAPKLPALACPTSGGLHGWDRVSLASWRRRLGACSTQLVLHKDRPRPSTAALAITAGREPQPRRPVTSADPKPVPGVSTVSDGYALKPALSLSVQRACVSLE